MKINASIYAELVYQLGSNFTDKNIIWYIDLLKHAEHNVVISIICYY